MEASRGWKIAPRAGVMLGIAVVFSAGFMPPAHADGSAKASAAYRDKNYSLAQILYHEQAGYDARMGEGAAAYRRQRYAEAVEQFTAALLNVEQDCVELLVFLIRDNDGDDEHVTLSVLPGFVNKGIKG